MTHVALAKQSWRALTRLNARYFTGFMFFFDLYRLG